MTIMPIQEPNPYATSTDIPETSYTPSTAELAVVDELIRQGCPEHVQFVEWANAYTAMKAHLIRFILLPEGKKYEAESYRMVAYPTISFNEMNSLGMVKA